MTRRLVVHVGGRRAGLLAAEPTGRHVFAYDADCPPERFVSLTMPVRLESYAWHELHPVFQVSLPEGAALQRLNARLAKSGATRAMDVLALVGADLLGRVQVVPEGADPVAPDAEVTAALPYDADALLRGGTTGFAHAAFNRWCCLRVAKRAGFDVPAAELSPDRATLRVRRFDGPRDTRLGYEDFCSLMGLGAGQKYEATAERMASAATAFVTAVQRTAVRRELFRRHALAYLLRSGDAHLKTFGVLYTGADDVRLAPVHELVTTSVYPEFRDDIPALVLGGRRTWTPKKGTWRRFGAHCSLADRETQSILQWLAQATEAEIPELERDATAGEREFVGALVAQWRTGAAELQAGY
jgi:serine/threonine-protein kinase HipA